LNDLSLTVSLILASFEIDQFEQKFPKVLETGKPVMPNAGPARPLFFLGPFSLAVSPILASLEIDQFGQKCPKVLDPGKPSLTAPFYSQPGGLKLH